MPAPGASGASHGFYLVFDRRVERRVERSSASATTPSADLRRQQALLYSALLLAPLAALLAASVSRDTLGCSVMAPIRVGVIGAGANTKKFHIPLLQKQDGVEVSPPLPILPGVPVYPSPPSFRSWRW